jgi:hypothetical protein
MRRLPCLMLLLAASGCSNSETAGSDGELAATASASASATVAPAVGFVLPPPRPFNANPLGLSTAPVTVEEGDRVFAVPRRMLEHAKLGSTMLLEPGRVEGREGEDLIVRVKNGVPYPVHPAYVVVPHRGRIGRGTSLLVAYRDVVHHAVARNVAHDRVVVRITDAGRKLPDQKLDPEDVGMLEDGVLEPGGHAAFSEKNVQHHVMLVSRGRHEGKWHWLVFGMAGEAQLIEESRLQALPRQRHDPRPGDKVLVAFRGAMVSAEVRAVDAPGLFTVKRERAGEPLLVGPGWLMPAGAKAP